MPYVLYVLCVLYISCVTCIICIICIMLFYFKLYCVICACYMYHIHILYASFTLYYMYYIIWPASVAMNRLAIGNGVTHECCLLLQDPGLGWRLPSAGAARARANGIKGSQNQPSYEGLGHLHDPRAQASRQAMCLAL